MEEIKSGSQQKAAMTSNERQLKARAKLAAINSGSFKITLVEEAKEELLKMGSPDLDTLMGLPRYREGLNSDEKKQLTTFLYNHRQRCKRGSQLLEAKEAKDGEFKAKAQRLLNERIPELQQALLLPQAEAEKEQTMLKKIIENPFLFLEYMKSDQPPTCDMLLMIVKLQPAIEEATFTRLFVRVCALNKGDELSVSARTVQLTMEFLVDSADDYQSAYGLLRLLFQNQLSLSTFPRQLLIKFQKCHQLALNNFFKSLPNIKSHVRDSLPSTCFCFTTPMLEALMAGGDALHECIPPQFLPHIIEIIAYSFTESSQEFNDFLSSIKLVSQVHYYQMIMKGFDILLSGLLHHIKAMKTGYFGTLEASTRIIKRAHTLLGEKRIEYFDSPTVSMLIEDKLATFMVMNQRPRCSDAREVDSEAHLIAQIESCNPQINFVGFPVDLPLSSKELSYFTSLGISKLLPTQKLCFRLCLEKIEAERLFIQYQTGQGKTALCFGLASHWVSQGKGVVIVNQSFDLTFRDFKKATPALRTLGISAKLAEEEMKLDDWSSPLIFASYNQVVSSFAHLPQSTFQGKILIIDEYDSIVFERRHEIHELAKLLEGFGQLVAFTGSQMLPCHDDYVSAMLGGIPLNMNPPSVSATDQICMGVTLSSTKQEFNRLILELCIRQTELTPVIIILDESFEAQGRLLTRNGIPVEVLATQGPAQGESSLQQFCLRQGERFSAFIINPEQGRGIDFPTSSEIQQNGGVYVLIATLPAYYLQFKQFVGRTGRVGSVGQYSVQLLDRGSKHFNGGLFLEKKLEELKNNDILYLASFHKALPPSSRGSETIQNHEGQKITRPLELIELKVESGNYAGYDATMELDSHTDSESWDSVAAELLLHKAASIDFSPERHMPSRTVIMPNNKRTEKAQSKQKRAQGMSLRARDSLRARNDEGYFQSYSEPQIHAEMLSDAIRMEAYASSIKRVSYGKSVVDVGAGSGALSIMAAQAGASRVYAIEYSGIATTASRAIIDNKVADVVVLINSLAEDAYLPNGRVDILVSEWMGYFLLCENMLGSVLEVRDTWLKDDGIMLPSGASMFLACFENRRDMGGLNFSSLSNMHSQQARIERCRPETIVSTSDRILELDLRNDRLKDSTFSSEFTLVMNITAQVAGIVGWFDMQMTEGLQLSTSPMAPPTHWSQTLFYFQGEVEIAQGEQLTGRISVCPQELNHRALDITFEFSSPPQLSKKLMTYFLG